MADRNGMIDAILIPAGVEPLRVVSFHADDTAALHDLVGGHLEMFDIHEHGILWLDEDGQRKELRPNSVATWLTNVTNLTRRPTVILGDAVLTGSNPPEVDTVPWHGAVLLNRVVGVYGTDGELLPDRFGLIETDDRLVVPDGPAIFPHRQEQQ